MGGQGYLSFSTSNSGNQETASYRPSLEIVKPAMEGLANELLLSISCTFCKNIVAQILPSQAAWFLRSSDTLTIS